MKHYFSLFCCKKHKKYWSQSKRNNICVDLIYFMFFHCKIIFLIHIVLRNLFYVVFLLKYVFFSVVFELFVFIVVSGCFWYFVNQNLCFFFKIILLFCVSYFFVIMSSIFYIQYEILSHFFVNNTLNYIFDPLKLSANLYNILRCDIPLSLLHFHDHLTIPYSPFTLDNPWTLPWKVPSQSLNIPSRYSFDSPSTVPLQSLDNPSTIPRQSLDSP